MAGYYETKTFLRDEWEELQKGVEAQLRTSYDQYLKRVGLKNEAEAIAKRKKEDAAGKKFGAQDVPFGVLGTAKPEDRKITSEYAKELGTAQALNDAQAAKQIAALTGGRITGNEPVYQFGTPEFNKYMQDQAAQGKTPVPPDAYLDAQAFAERYVAYSRLGTTEPDSLLWNNETKTYYRKPSPFYDANIEVPIVGMGTEWAKLNQAKLGTLGQGVGSTAATDAAQYEIDKLFGQGMGYAPGGTIRDFRSGEDASVFKRDPKKEAAAIARGTITKEELERRGGINASGYYGDSYNPETSLTDEEYAAAIAGKTGIDVGKAINAAVAAKASKNKLTPGSGATSSEATTYTAPDGRIFTDLAQYNAYIEQTKQEEKTAKGQSAYDLLFDRFNEYGMGALVEPLKQFIQQGLSSSELTLRLRDTDAYKKRFAANAQRVAKGLRALSEAEYIGKEDAYQDIMRRYGLPESYYTRGEMGRQEGFEKIIANDISDVELEDRISTAQKRVLNANPEVTQALKQFYPDITNADILAYTLDPKNAIENIKRKVTAAEIGGAAIQSGLQTGVSRAEQLQAAGVTKAAAQEGFGTIAGGLQRGSQLASIYGEDPYTQTTAETEVFNIAGAQEARKQRQKITGLEKATFGGQSGLTSGALARDRAGGY
jgi:hypothetical protein